MREGVKATRMAIHLMRSNRFPESRPLLEEKKIIIQEARSILDKALEMGDGDPVLASLRSIQAGVLDIPWAPNQSVAGKVIPVRDASGAVRYLDHANLPFEPGDPGIQSGKDPGKGAPGWKEGRLPGCYF